jgi:hypothetical protein
MLCPSVTYGYLEKNIHCWHAFARLPGAQGIKDGIDQ